jgi:hypothetical protein
MTSKQLTTSQQSVPSITSIDPTPIVQSDSPTAVILAIAILLSTLMNGVTQLVRTLPRSK